MELLAYARITMWEGASLWIVDATPPAGVTPRRTDFHAHHAIQVTISLGGSFALRTETENCLPKKDRWRSRCARYPKHRK